jgi:predicted DNA-binding protein
MTERINARLDTELSRKLAYLRKRTGRSTTEILRASLESYYQKIHGETDAASLLEEFVGCAEGAVDLAANYKTELGKSLAQKSRPR